MMDANVNNIALSGGFSQNPVIADGRGRPLVYLHGLFGQEWPAYLADLAKYHRVYAPVNPGSEEPADLRLLDGLLDLIVYYDELFEQLGLEQVDLIGHSFGGMVAAEIAATLTHRVRKLVLIDPLGLWRDDAPVGDHLLVSPEQRTALLYHDLSNAEVAARLSEPEDLAESQAGYLRSFSAMASTAHFIHPIPERGLHKRLRRIKADTLVLWGAQDRLVPPVYAQDFARGIPNASVQVLDRAGHYPHLEQRERVTAETLRFLA
ncbi:alpha/beta hydrolase [Pseudonocardia kujensis]|uniref:alpha/beta fold hydrolase n=1 Tax=Pseudonocardia kujensis TaxID=1128675 RepID=UPI001E577198|nr:alpha/beta hydrolase [Pseudonocardia kujensis]MCE0767743.1 alpha/beta hydrolase [Pseudonocardia kujensis]